MAKRYTRINYQDSPSTATPLSAANLNKMDKGIDDLDNAIEALSDNLAVIIPVTFVPGVTGFCVKNNIIKIARLYVSISSAVANSSIICTLPQEVWGAADVIVNTLAYQEGNIGRVAITVAGGNGNVVASALEYNLTINNVSVYIEWPTVS